MAELSPIVSILREKRDPTKTQLQRAAVPFRGKNLNDKDFVSWFVLALVAGLTSGILSWLIQLLFGFNFDLNPHLWFLKPAIFGTAIFWGVLLTPYINLLYSCVIYGELPNFRRWQKYTLGQRFAANLALAIWFTFLFVHFIFPLWSNIWCGDLHSALLNYSLPSSLHDWLSQSSCHRPHHKYEYSGLPSITFKQGLLVFIGLVIVLTWVTNYLSKRPGKIGRNLLTEKVKQVAGLKTPETPLNSIFTLWVGQSTGKFQELYHSANIAPRQELCLLLEDAAKNILVLGAIGSGKTTAVINPLLVQLLDQECGGLVFDIKGNFGGNMTQAALITNRQFTPVGVNYSKINLLQGLNPEMAASFIKSTLLITSGRTAEGFWIETAAELCRNILGVLSFNKKHYHLQGLYRYLFEINWRKEIDQGLETKFASETNSRDLRLFETYRRYLSDVFGHFDEKVRSGVMATISQILSPFNHPDLIDSFCSHTDEINWEDIINREKVFLVQLPLATYGLGAKVVYNLIKLRFFNLMQSRTLHSDWNQSKPVFFLCDEYQEIIACNKDGISDLNFWDKSRESKTIGIISGQSIASFYAAINDRDTANAVLQNFRQKICFTTEDQLTIDYLSSIVGDAEAEVITHSSGSGKSSGGGKGLFNTQRHSNTNVSYTKQRKAVITGQLFRELNPNQAIALLSINRRSFDDVINTLPVYFN